MLKSEESVNCDGVNTLCESSIEQGTFSVTLEEVSEDCEFKARHFYTGQNGQRIYGAWMSKTIEEGTVETFSGKNESNNFGLFHNS